MKEEQKLWPGTLAAALALLLALAVFRVPAGAAVQASGAACLEAARPGQAEAVGHMVIPLGRAVGIKLFSDGVMVVGLSDVTTGAGGRSPARDCGLREGDIITHINREEVDSIEEVQSILQGLSGEKMSLRAVRGDKQVQLTAQAVQCSADGAYKLGAWIRDSMAGIGTMTFYDPTSGAFGALGHGINDVDTSLLMPLQSGSIMYAEVTDVQKGACGVPGELHGAFQVSRDMGQLYANTVGGVFGTLTDRSLAAGGAAVEVAGRREVKVGKATILSNIAGSSVEAYEVEISRIYPDGGDTRDLMLKVTDPRLLEATGGIVQGMVVMYNRDNTGKPCYAMVFGAAPIFIDRKTGPIPGAFKQIAVCAEQGRVPVGTRPCSAQSRSAP